MSTKSFIALGFCGVAALLFLFVGFDIVATTKYDLVALGLCSWVVGYMINTFVTQP